MNTEQLRQYAAWLNKTRRRSVSYSINGLSVLLDRQTAKEVSRAILAGKERP